MQRLGRLNASKDQRATSERYAEMARRLDRVRHLLALGWSKGRISRVCSQEWGIKSKCMPSYLAGARKRAAERIADDPNQTLCQSLEFWYFQLNKAISRAEKESAAIEAIEKQLGELALTQTDERSGLMRLLESHRKRRYGAEQDSFEVFDRIDRLRGHVHSGGSASVIIQQQFINGGALTEVQRAEQLEAMGFDVAPALPVATGIPAIVDAHGVNTPST